MATPTQETPPYVEHIGDTRQYWRDIILGVNDGLVSVFLLVAGVVGGGMATKSVLLTAITAAIAGAISMAAGEYIATKSQEEVFEAEIELEREHLLYHRQRELDELDEMFEDLGLEEPLRGQVVEAFDKDEEALMKIMVALEFGVVDEERRSPWLAAMFSGLLFLAGSLPSIIPFMFSSIEPTRGLIYAAIFSGLALFGVGVAKTVVTKGNPWRAGFENLAIAAGGAVLSFAAGSAYENAFG